jgi:hypothetical protein
MKISNGSYININPDMKGNICMSASIMCNEKEVILQYAAYIRNNGGMIFYNYGTDDKYLVTYDKFKKIEDNFKCTHPPKLLKLQNYNDSDHIHKEYDKTRSMYRDRYRKKELLMENCHNFCKDLELKYLLVKEYLLQNHGDVFLMGVIFDIKHYLAILLCYYGEIDYCTYDIGNNLYYATKLLLDNNLQTWQDDDEDGDLLNMDESIIDMMKRSTGI